MKVGSGDKLAAVKRSLHTSSLWLPDERKIKEKISSLFVPQIGSLINMGANVNENVTKQ